jgi:hypothetical protein
VSEISGGRGLGTARNEAARQTAFPGAEQSETNRATARRHAAASLARRHWLATVLLTAGLALRVLAQFAYRPALFYIDSIKYIYSSQGNDPEGYKAPVRAILFVANFNTVVAVQHLLGLAMAVMIYVLLQRRGVSRWLAALAIAPVLLDAYQLQQEQTIMPTTWFEALLVAGLVILLWNPKPGWRATVAAGLVLGTSATVWQAGEALIPAAAIYVLAAAGSGWRQAIGKAAALIGAFALPILAYCTGSYLITGQFALSHQGVTSLYGRTAAAVDCTTIKLTPAERSICPDKTQQAKGDDWLEYNPAAPVQRIYRDLPRPEVDSIVTNFSHRVLTQQPLRVLEAYGRDVLKIYAVYRQTAPGDPPISRWQFATTFPYLYPHATKPEIAAMTRQFGGGQPTVWRPGATFLHYYQVRGGYTPGPLLVLCTLAGAFGSLVALIRRRGLDARTRELALACLLCFGSALFLLLVADAFVFSWRYQLPALVTLVPAGALGVATFARLFRGRRGSIQPDPSN